MIGKDLDEQIVDSVETIEKRRYLLGFMNQVPALRQLEVSHSLRNPLSPTLDDEEIERIQAENREEFLKTWREAQNSVDDSPPNFLSGAVGINEFPGDDEIDSYLQDFMGQDHFQQLIDGVPDEAWGFRLVPIEQIVAGQPSVAISGHHDIPTSEDGILEVIKYCLPIRGNKYVMAEQFNSGRFQGVNLVSRGPNINVSGFNLEREPDSDNFTVQFQIKPNINLVQVVQYGNRFILRNGYHRSFQLLRSGETHVPAYVQNINDFQATGLDKPGMFSQDLIMSGRPPLMYDFQTDAAVDLDSAGTNKVIKIMAETYPLRR